MGSNVWACDWRLTLLSYSEERWVACIPHGDQSWRFLDLYGFDEPLWLAACILFGKSAPEQAIEQNADGRGHRRVLAIPDGQDYWMTLDCPCGTWVWRHSDGRFSPRMDPCEALGFLASHLLSGEGTYGGWRNYEEFLQREPWGLGEVKGYLPLMI